MNKEEIKELVDKVYTGSKWQWNRTSNDGVNPPGWVTDGNPDGSDYSLLHLMQKITENRQVRLKPQPVKRLIRVDELPAVFWVKEHVYVKDADIVRWQLCSAVDEFAFKFGGCTARWAEVKEDWRWSPDRKEIGSFYVEDTTLDERNEAT